MQETLVRFALSLATRLRHVRVRGLPRMLYTTAPLVLGRGKQILPTISGLRLCVDVRDYGSCMMVYGRFAPELESLLRHLVQPGDSVLDVGAQLGFTTSLLGELVGVGGHVHSFEPDPTALTQLRATVAANDQSQVTIFPLAAGDHEGELTFHLSPTIGWSTAVTGSHHRDLEAVRVPSARIDHLDAAGRIVRPVRLVKIDVEGWECAVLDGMQTLLARDRPYVVTELAQLMLQPNQLSTADVLDRIVRHGYRVYRLSEAKGILAGGRFELTPMDPTRVVDFCDAVCVPEERQI